MKFLFKNTMSSHRRFIYAGAFVAILFFSYKLGYQAGHAIGEFVNS